eukprot:GHRR01000551.1.p1 GENE.GHRR01000551.1~~GHRR01000551.1.p1  ORF type:complete len:601 (+),score=258.81 GHRR01000551.1:339-2141(+)
MGANASRHLDGSGSQLVKAAKAGDADLVMELVSRHPELLQYTTMRQFGAVHFAARANHVEVLQHVLMKAAEVEYLYRLQKGTKRQLSLVQQLVNAASDRGVTPLMLAADRGCYESVKLLLDKGADPWAVDKLGGRTALHYAARYDNIAVLQLLIEAAGEQGPVRFPNRQNTKYVDVRTQTGFTAVHMAVHANAQQALAVLLGSTANLMLSSLFDSLDCINCPRGSTPMHLAARSGNEVVAKQLLKAYVETWAQRQMPDPRLIMDGDDQLPCQVAASRQHRALAAMLLPSASLAAIFTDDELPQIGPPSLASLAAAALRGQLDREFSSIEQGAQQHGCQPANGLAPVIDRKPPWHAAAYVAEGLDYDVADAAADEEPAGAVAIRARPASAGIAPAACQSAAALPVDEGFDSAIAIASSSLLPAEWQATMLAAGVDSRDSSNSDIWTNVYEDGRESNRKAEHTTAAEQANEHKQQPPHCMITPDYSNPTAATSAGDEMSSSSVVSSDELSSEDDVCGVCFDTQPVVALAPCNHQLCVSCCRHLLAMNSRCVLACPFCRSSVGHLALVGQQQQQSAPATLAFPAAAAAAAAWQTVAPSAVSAA